MKKKDLKSVTLTIKDLREILNHIPINLRGARKSIDKKEQSYKDYEGGSLEHFTKTEEADKDLLHPSQSKNLFQRGMLSP